MRKRRKLLALFGILMLVLVNAGAGLVASSGEALADEAPTNGQIAFSTGRDGGDNIYVMNADGTDQTRLTTVAGNHAGPSWSPDGTRLVFHSDRDGNGEIYVMNADGTDQTRLTDNAAGDYSAAWSPDGTQIAFTSKRDGNYEIYVMNADGSDQTRITDNTSNEQYPAWSPDGTRIAFSTNRDGNWELYSMNADGAGETRLTNNGAWDERPVWSPDGTQIAFYSDRDGDFEIYVMNADGSGQTQLTSTFRSAYPAWSPDGTQIAFMTFLFGAKSWEIFVMDADGGNPVNLTNADSTDFGPAWGPVPTPPDETPPTVTITTPADEATYLQGEEVLADYECTDDVTVDPACVGDVAVGAAIDTAALGNHEFTVTGTDDAGNDASVTHSYTVVDVTAPSVTITTPADGATYVQGVDDPLADYACTDEAGGSGVASCVGNVPMGAAIDTATLGSHNFTVTGTDNAGNTASVTHSYEVVANTPPNKAACKKGGWRDFTDHFGTPFKNQGDCVSYVATGGRNLANG